MRVSTNFRTGENAEDMGLIMEVDFRITNSRMFGVEPDPAKIGECVNAALNAFNEEWIKEAVSFRPNPSLRDYV